MARKTKADMEVLEVKEKTKVKKVKTAAATEPTPPVVPEKPIYVIVPFRIMDVVLAEIKAGKTVAEAIAVDPKLAADYADHPFLIARETRNGYYYALRDDLVPTASATLHSIGVAPVSYAIPK